MNYLFTEAINNEPHINWAADFVQPSDQYYMMKGNDKNVMIFKYDNVNSVSFNLKLEITSQINYMSVTSAGMTVTADLNTATGSYHYITCIEVSIAIGRRAEPSVYVYHVELNDG